MIVFNFISPKLNAEIAKLQEMQHKYSLIEFESTKSIWLNQVSNSLKDSPFQSSIQPRNECMNWWFVFGN